MIKLVFESSKGQKIELYSNPFRLSKVEGLGDVGAEIQTQRAPYQDGSTYIDSILEERNISIELKISGVDELDFIDKKRKFASAFNPKLGPGKLQYIDASGEKEIGVISEGVPFFPSGFENRGRTYQKALLYLRAPNPYWLSKGAVEQLVVWEGGLKFPLRLPTRFARQSASGAKILLNEGDVETPLRIVFNGPATAPVRIENTTTGEMIEVNQNLAVGERIEINTAFGQKRVEKVLADGTRTNAFHYIKRGSKFFQLIPGNNLLDYSTGEDYERAGVTITWNNRYLSV